MSDEIQQGEQVEQPKAEKSIIPTGNIPVDVPEDVIPSLPLGTQVSMNEQNQLVASVEREGTVHHIVSKAVAEFEHLVAAVEEYFG